MIAKSRLSSESEETPKSPEEVADSPAGVADKLSILRIKDNGSVKFVGKLGSSCCRLAYLTEQDHHRAYQYFHLAAFVGSPKSLVVMNLLGASPR